MWVEQQPRLFVSAHSFKFRTKNQVSNTSSMLTCQGDLEIWTAAGCSGTYIDWPSWQMLSLNCAEKEQLIIHSHSPDRYLLVPHLKTFATPSRLHSSPSFPNRASTSFKISLGSTSTPAIPEAHRITHQFYTPAHIGWFSLSTRSFSRSNMNRQVLEAWCFSCSQLSQQFSEGQQWCTEEAWRRLHLTPP